MEEGCVCDEHGVGCWSMAANCDCGDHALLCHYCAIEHKDSSYCQCCEDDPWGSFCDGDYCDQCGPHYRS